MPFKKGETPKGAKVFQPGESGNPKGREIGSKNRSTIVKEIFDALVTLPEKQWNKYKEFWPDLPQQITGERMITYAAAFRALKRDMSYKNLMDSRYGAPKQEVEHSGEVEIGFDIGKLDDEDLKTILQITQKAKNAD